MIEDGYEQATTRLGERLNAAFNEMGLDLGDGLSSYQLGVAVGSLVEGLSLRLRYDHDDTAELTISENGTTTERGLPGVCLEALVDRFYMRS